MQGIAKFRNVIFATLIFLASVAVVQAASFSDVSDDHPNAAAIDFLSKDGVIGGYPDGSFRPEAAVNRAEALKILLLASDFEIQNPLTDVFPDVPTTEWFAPFVFSARTAEIVDGYLDGTFRPDQTVNLVEALKILLNTNAVPLENYTTQSQLFADSEKNAWYNPFLLYAKTFSLVEPDSANRIRPATPLTRGALAEVVYRFRTRVETVCPRMFENTHAIASNYFREVLLESELPRIFFENEVFPVRGSLTEPAESVSAVLENRDDKSQVQFLDDSDDDTFAITVTAGSPGSYNFSVIPATIISNAAAAIEVLPRECAPATVVSSGLAPSNIQTSLVDNEPTISWTDAENNIFRIVLRQDDNRVEKMVSGGQYFVTLDPADFVDFVEGPATLQVFGAKSENGFSHEPRTSWFGSPIAELSLSQHHFSTREESEIQISSLPNYREPRVSFAARALADLENEAYVITPRGKIEIVPILNDVETIAAGTNFILELDLPEVGTYILELNGTDGIAALNHPLYLPSEFPLLPDFADLRTSADNENISMNRERAIWLKLINDFRAQNQLSKVELDADLSAFAQEYADEMVTKDFFGHVDPSGRDPEQRRKDFGLSLPVGENLARDSKTEYAHAGLLRSAVHRQNIIEPEWTRVGLGIARTDDGQLVFVQEFSTSPLDLENPSEPTSQLLELINERRRELGFADFSLDGQLEPAAQSWSEKMAAENFTDFTAADDSLENTVRATGYSGGFASFLVSAGRLSQIVESLSDDVLADSAKSQIAIGLAQDADGRILATLVFR